MYTQGKELKRLFVMTISLMIVSSFTGQAYAADMVGHEVHFDLESMADEVWIEFLGCTFTNPNTECSWKVSVASGVMSVSHVTIGIETCLPSFLSATPDGVTIELGLDPTTGVTGVKWDDLIAAGTMETLTAVLSGDQTGNIGLVDVGVKAGNDVRVDQIKGPLCTPFIGGFLEPIDTTAVLLGGTQTAASWLIPIIVSAIGIGIFIARKL